MSKLRSNEKMYLSIFEFFSKHIRVRRVVTALDAVLPMIFFCIYPLLPVFSLVKGYNRTVALVAVPAFAFLIVTLFRHTCDVPRPYETMNIPTLTSQKKRGKSMPSRHVFSAFIIAMSAFCVNAAVGVILLAAAAVLAVTRVLVGAHRPLEVVCGAAVGVLFGLIELYIAL